MVDASCLAEVLVNRPLAEQVRERLLKEPDQLAPHVIDVEVFSVIRMLWMRQEIDDTASSLAVDELALWPGERVSHRSLLLRAWELGATVRGWDAMYVALAEVVEAPLLTLDARLASASGPQCTIELVSAS